MYSEDTLFNRKGLHLVWKCIAKLFKTKNINDLKYVRMILLSEKAEADSQVCYFEERVLVYLEVCVFIYVRGFEQYIL